MYIGIILYHVYNVNMEFFDKVSRFYYPSLKIKENYQLKYM